MKEEFFLENGRLISAVVWHEKIASLRSGVKVDLIDKSEAVRLIAEQIVKNISDRISDEKVGLLLSGGVDSSLIALILKKVGVNFTCYTIGFKNDDTKDPEDVDAARKVAKELELDLKLKIVDANEAEDLIGKTVRLLGPELSNVVSVGVAAVEVGCIELAKKDGVSVFFGGIGSEEIFAGYERHKNAAAEKTDVNEECWNGLFNMRERDLLRDCKVAEKLEVSFRTPFLDENLIKLAMSVPGKYKLDSEHSKLILREAAEKLGLPKDFAWRKKRAAQYGSRIDSAIDKLARKNGFEFKKDYLKSLL